MGAVESALKKRKCTSRQLHMERSTPSTENSQERELHQKSQTVWNESIGEKGVGGDR